MSEGRMRTLVPGPARYAGRPDAIHRWMVFGLTDAQKAASLIVKNPRSAILSQTKPSQDKRITPLWNRRKSLGSFPEGVLEGEGVRVIARSDRLEGWGIL